MSKEMSAREILYDTCYEYCKKIQPKISKGWISDREKAREYKNKVIEKNSLKLKELIKKGIPLYIAGDIDRVFAEGYNTYRKELEEVLDIIFGKEK